VEQGAHKEWTFRKRHHTKQTGSHSIRNRGFKEQLHLGSKKVSGRIFRKMIRLGITKQIARSSVRMRKMRDWTLWRGLPPPKGKKRLHSEEEPEMWEHRPL
jgi:hypothetical protein